MIPFKKGDRIICLSDHGWSPGCVTVGKIYIVEHLYDDYMNIIGDNGALFKTDDRCFQNYSEYLSEKRESKIDKILNSSQI
jgi:hypothetical protein